VGASVRPCGGGDAAWLGEVSGTPMTASMKGLRRLRRRGPGTGVATAVKGSRHGGSGDDDGVPAATTSAPVASLVVLRQQRAREMKICQVISGRRRVPNL
jgi:hypothetical protein